jgi:hypothetical protein
MTKKYFSIILFTLFSFQIQAQSFSIRITQVYPAGGVVYGNSYNLSGELNRAEEELRRQYTGRDANYIMELTRPSGRETKTIQNIHWILIENGVRRNFRTEPTFEDSYPQAMTMEWYACHNNGTPRGQRTTKNFHYRYRVSKDDIVVFTSEYMTLEKSKSLAKEFFEENKIDSVFCEIIIIDKDEKSIVSSSFPLNNKVDYERYIRSVQETMEKEQEVQKIVDDAKNAKISKADIQRKVINDIINYSIVVDSIYHRERINTNLIVLDSYINPNNVFLNNKDIFLNKVVEILSVMKKHPSWNRRSSNFKEDEYFGVGKTPEEWKKGINELQTINQRLR